MQAVRWLAAYWLVALATHASGLFQPMHCDYSCRLRVAREWAGGKILYRETYDNPQPVVFLWILAVDSPRPAVSAYLAETALAAAASAVFRAALLLVVPRIAGVIPLLLIVFSGVSPTFYGGQIAEAPAMWLDVIGLSCFWLALQTNRYWLALIAGLAFFLTVSFRVPSAIHLISWLPLLWFSLAKRLTAWSFMATAVGGAVLGMAALYLHGQAYGYWEEFLVVFRRNLNYGAMDRVPLAASLIEGGKTLARIHLANSLVGLLAVTGAVVLFSLWPRLRQREKTWTLVALLWLTAALAGAFPGGRHYAHYYHLTWPSVTLIATLWLAPLRRMTRLTRRGANPVDRLSMAVVVGALFMGIAGQVFSATKAIRDFRQGTHSRNAIEQAATFLNRETKTDTPVLVHVWLDWAELYWRVPRPPPSFSIPHVVPRDLYADWLEKTSRALPEWIVTDGTPWEPIDGSLIDDETKAARDAFVARIERDYAEVQRIAELRILRRVRQ